MNKNRPIPLEIDTMLKDTNIVLGKIEDLVQWFEEENDMQLIGFGQTLEIAAQNLRDELASRK